MKIIKKKILRRVIDVYKTIATKILKMKTYVLFINVHLKKLLQNSIVNMNARCLINVINTMMKRIKRNLMSKKKIKITNDFFTDKKMLNAQMFKKGKNNTQSILHRNVINEFFKNNH